MRKTTIITDPVHQVMNLGSDPLLRKCLKGVVDTPAFQRLRRISQLGLASFVFPGATHTRFSHCLGSVYLAYTVLWHLRERADASEERELKELSNEVLMAALLHDAGHGPFSHSFENVLKAYREPNDPPMHEDWTAAVISEPASEVRNALAKNNLNIQRIASVFQKKPKGEKFPPYLKQLVSSQLDVDRMDYLVRDSHFAGVAVGRFDVQYLINSLVLVKHGAKGSRTLGLTPKGIKAYEAFILARQLMNRTVYYHRKVKVLEYMMEQLIREVLQNLPALASTPEVAPHIPPYFSALAKMADGSLKCSKDEFIQQQLANYLALTEDRVWSLVAILAGMNPRDRVLSRKLADMLLRREVLPSYPVLAGKHSIVEEGLSNAGLKRNLDFGLVELQTTVYKAGDKDKVFVLNWDGKIEEIPAFSETITALKDKPEVEALLIVLDLTKQSEIERLALDMQAVSK